MDDKKTSIKEEKEKISESNIYKITNNSKSDEMEEFQLKIHVDLEEAFSRRDDYLDILQRVYSQSEEAEKTEYTKFGLVSSKKTEDIYLISCVYKNGRPLFNYPLSDKFNYTKSLDLILTVIKNYVQYKLGELLEVLSLESHTIHLFAVEEDYIVSIITSKQITRDKVSMLAIQMGIILNKYSGETPYTNLDLKKEIDQIVETAISSLVKQHHTFKIILIGDGAVGKTSIRRQYLGEGFKSDYQMTIGADLASKNSSLIYAGGKQIKFLIWDLAGQPRFENVRKAYFMAAVGALVVFDATRHGSFTNIVKWMNELWRNNGRGPVPLIVLANKIDLCGEEGVNCVAEGKVVAFINRLSQISEKYRGFKIHYIPTSAKTGQNIDYAFEILGEAIIDFLGKIKS